MSDLFAYVEEAKAAGRNDLALLEFADLIEARLGGIEPFHRRADLLRAMGRTEEATADYRRAAMLEPDNGWPLLWLAQYALEQDRRWLAAAEIDEAVRRDPDTIEFRINAAKIFATLDWHDRAWAAVRDLPDDLGGWWGEERRDAHARLRAQRADTLARLRRRRIAPLDGAERFDLAIALLRLGRLSPARRLCERLMADEPRSFPAFEVHGWIVARREGAAAALAFLRAMRFLHAGNPDYERAIAAMAGQVAPPPPELIPDEPPR